MCTPLGPIAGTRGAPFGMGASSRMVSAHYATLPSDSSVRVSRARGPRPRASAGREPAALPGGSCRAHFPGPDDSRLMAAFLVAILRFHLRSVHAGNVGRTHDPSRVAFADGAPPAPR